MAFVLAFPCQAGLTCFFSNPFWTTVQPFFFQAILFTKKLSDLMHAIICVLAISSFNFLYSSPNSNPAGLLKPWPRLTFGLAAVHSVAIFACAFLTKPTLVYNIVQLCRLIAGGDFQRAPSATLLNSSAFGFALVALLPLSFKHLKLDVRVGRIHVVLLLVTVIWVVFQSLDPSSIFTLHWLAFPVVCLLVISAAIFPLPRLIFSLLLGLSMGLWLQISHFQDSSK